MPEARPELPPFREVEVVAVGDKNVIFNVESATDFVSHIRKRMRRGVVEVELSEIARNGIDFDLLK